MAYVVHKFQHVALVMLLGEIVQLPRQPPPRTSSRVHGGGDRLHLDSVPVLFVKDVRQLSNGIMHKSNVIVILPEQKQSLDSRITVAIRSCQHAGRTELEVVFERFDSG